MNILKYISYLALSILLISCSTKESNAILTPESYEIKLNHFSLMDSIKTISITTNSWKEVDKFYKLNVAPVTNNDLVNHTIFWLSNPKANFFEEANIQILEYYLEEAKNANFNINLRLIVEMLKKIGNNWSKEYMTEYAKSMYSKNVLYWKKYYPEQTIYLDKNKEALDILLEIQNK